MFLVYSNDKELHRNEIRKVINKISTTPTPTEILEKISTFKIISREDLDDEICCVCKVKFNANSEVMDMLESTKLIASMDEGVKEIFYTENDITVNLTIITETLENLVNLNKHYYDNFKDAIYIDLTIKPEYVDCSYVITSSLEPAIFNTDAYLTGGIFYVRYKESIDIDTFYTYLAIIVCKTMDSLMLKQVYLDFEVNYSLLISKLKFLTNIDYSEDVIRSEVFTDCSKFINN